MEYAKSNVHYRNGGVNTNKEVKGMAARRRRTVSRKNKRYTAAQKDAYQRGMGYRAAQEGRVIPYSNQANAASFRAGYKAAGAAVSKYPKKGNRK